MGLGLGDCWCWGDGGMSVVKVKLSQRPLVSHYTSTQKQLGSSLDKALSGTIIKSAIKYSMARLGLSWHKSLYFVLFWLCFILFIYLWYFDFFSPTFQLHCLWREAICSSERTYSHYYVILLYQWHHELWKWHRQQFYCGITWNNIFKQYHNIPTAASHPGWY